MAEIGPHSEIRLPASVPMVFAPDRLPARDVGTGGCDERHDEPTLAEKFGVEAFLSKDFALLYRVRQLGNDSDRRIFEASFMERFPAGEVPVIEWVKADPYEPGAWPPVLVQDFNNMSQVQRGMRSSGFRGCLPNPKQEAPIGNFHHNLAKYMGTGAPKPLG